MKLERRQNRNKEIRDSLAEKLDECTAFLKENFTSLEMHNYQYSPNEAIEELGLDLDLVNQLVEDYVIQILKSKVLFISHLQELKSSKKLDYTPLRELAHKNLGVARNLRIEDAKKVLEELMKADDLDYLCACIEALESCAIRLRPKCAYETLKLIDIKESL